MFNSLDKFNRQLLRPRHERQGPAGVRPVAGARAGEERDGRHAYGFRCLMARRLVEAGCTFVTMVLDNPMPGELLPNDVSLQLGFARGELPPVQRRPAAVPAVRSGDHGA